MVYATASARRTEPGNDRALVMVHGAGRNADHYFETAPRPASSPARSRTQSSSRRTSPREPTSPPPTKSCGPRGATWRSGGMSTNTSTVVRLHGRDPPKAREQEDLPEPHEDRRRRTLGGRPVGDALRDGEQGARHARREISYVVANPSSYAWPAAVRPLPTGTPIPRRPTRKRSVPTARRCTETSRSARSTRRRRRTSIAGPPDSRIVPATRPG